MAIEIGNSPCTVLGGTVIGAIERGHYVLRHNGRVLASEPLLPHAYRMEVGAECVDVIQRMGDTEIGGAFFDKIKKATKKTVSKVASAAKTVAKNKATKALYNAAKQAAPSPYKEYIAGAETAVRFTKEMTKNTPKGKAAKAALPVVQQLAAGKISLKDAQAKGKALGLKPETIRDTAAAIKLRASSSPIAKSVMAVVNDIEQVNNAPTRIVQAQSGRRYEVTVRAAS